MQGRGADVRIVSHIGPGAVSGGARTGIFEATVVLPSTGMAVYATGSEGQISLCEY